MKTFFIFLSLSFNGICFSQTIAYNKFYQVACHNCFIPKYINITEVLSISKAIEIDIWDNYRGSGFFNAGNKMNQDWYVKHDILQKGNVNCCGGSFRDCLIAIKNWSNEHKNHDVITIFIDKKENWSGSRDTRKPKDLDELIISIIGRQNIFTPSKLLADRPNLKEAVLANNWPTLDSLRGKFIFVVTNATEITHRNPLNEYLSAQHNDAVCFVAPEIKNESEIQNPPNFSPEFFQNIIFYNLDYSKRNLSPKLNALGCLSRVFNSPLPENKIIYNQLVGDKVNFIAFEDLRINK